MTTSASAPGPDLDRRDAAGAWASAVLLHPHPDYGGDRFNVVVDTLFRALPEGGVSAVRFDFASSDVTVAASQAAGAVDDAATAGRPVFLVGYSFGGDVATTVADTRLAGWFLVAPPLSLVAPAAMCVPADPRPKALAIPERDQFSPPERARSATAAWVNTTLEVVPGTDHFFAGPGAVAPVVDQALAWMRQVVDSTTG